MNVLFSAWCNELSRMKNRFSFIHIPSSFLINYHEPYRSNSFFFSKYGVSQKGTFFFKHGVCQKELFFQTWRKSKGTFFISWVE